MQDSTPGFSNTTNNSRKNKLKISPKTTLIIALVVVAVGVLVGIYNLGDNNGASRQKTLDDNQQKSKTALESKLPSFINNYWSIVGTVEDVSSKSIKVTNNKGITQEASVSSKTIVTEKSAKKTDISGVKKNDQVIVIGTKTDDGKYSASSIRIK